jgi:hypothetical protein
MAVGPTCQRDPTSFLFVSLFLSLGWSRDQRTSDRWAQELGGWPPCSSVAQRWRPTPPRSTIEGPPTPACGAQRPMSGSSNSGRKMLPSSLPRGAGWTSMATFFFRCCSSPTSTVVRHTPRAGASGPSTVPRGQGGPLTKSNRSRVARPGSCTHRPLACRSHPMAI